MSWKFTTTISIFVLAAVIITQIRSSIQLSIMIQLIPFQRRFVPYLLLILIVLSHEHIIIANLNLFLIRFDVGIVLVSNDVIN